MAAISLISACLRERRAEKPFQYFWTVGMHGLLSLFRDVQRLDFIEIRKVFLCHYWYYDSFFNNRLLLILSFLKEKGEVFSLFYLCFVNFLKVLGPYSPTLENRDVFSFFGKNKSERPDLKEFTPLF